MHKGISIWLDVPLEALADRIAAVGTDSRPLLRDNDDDDESRDAYTVVMNATFVNFGKDSVFLCMVFDHV